MVDRPPPPLYLSLGALPGEDERETTELLYLHPAQLDLLPSTVCMVCVLDPAVVVDADLRRLHVGSFGKKHLWQHLKPLMGPALPHPLLMQAAVWGSKVKATTDLRTKVAPLGLGASGNAGGVHFRRCISTSSACQHPMYVLWYKEPPEHRGPSPEVRRTLTEHQVLQMFFAGLVDGGAPGNVGLRLKGTKPARPAVMAHIAGFLGATTCPTPPRFASGATRHNWVWRRTTMRSFVAVPRRLFSGS